MNPNTQTPETDAELINGYRFSDAPDANRYINADFARKLERERDAYLLTIDKAKEEWERACAELDQLKKELAHTIDMACSEKVFLERDRDQLRKVCDSQDEMLKWYINEFGVPALGTECDKLIATDTAYNQLPHVKETK
jgi:hypothetical protein